MNRGLLFSFIVLLATFVTGSGYQLFSHDQEVIGKITKVDNSRLYTVGTAQLGEQILTIKILYGEHKGREVSARNILTGSMEYDELYDQGNKVLAALQVNDSSASARVLAHFRLPVLGGLFTLFAIFLIAYARTVGVKSLVSFVGSVIIIWKLLIPNLLNGASPLLWCWITLVILSALIIFSVAGLNRIAAGAFCGTIAGLIITSIASIVLGDMLHLNGMTQPLAQPLLFETSMNLNMLHILYAAVVIGASGAAMDIAMDMAATMDEVQKNNPAITRKELIRSGFNVGNVVIGTMTTTLLLAYSGGYLTLLMLFMSRDTSLLQIMNMKLVSVEIARTLIGSIALVIVAPLTAYICGWLYCSAGKPTENNQPLADIS